MNSTQDIIINKIEKGSKIRITSPEIDAPQFHLVYDLLYRELEGRLELTVEKAPLDQTQKDNSSALDIMFVTLETLPDQHYEFEPAPQIRPFEDYADHINLRFLKSGDTTTALVLTGSENAWIFGAGALLNQFCFYEEWLEFEPTPKDLKPLNPRRGCFFLNVKACQEYFNCDIESWFEMIRTNVLWGNNLLGLVPVWQREWESKHLWTPQPEFYSEQEQKAWEEHWDRVQQIQSYAHEMGLKNLVWRPYSKTSGAEIEHNLLRLSYREILWLTPHDRLLDDDVEADVSWKEFVQWTADIRQAYEQTDEMPEIWLGTSGYHEDDLTRLFEYADEGHKTFCDALVNGPEEGKEEMMRKEMPLNLQLITMSRLSDKLSNPISIAQTVQRFTDTAPLTFGSIGISGHPWDEVHRYLWSRMGWEPETRLDLLLQEYGNWYFGAESATYIKDGLMALSQKEASPQDQRSHALNHFMEARKRVPPAMKKFADPRMELMLKALDEG